MVHTLLDQCDSVSWLAFAVPGDVLLVPKRLAERLESPSVCSKRFTTAFSLLHSFWSIKVYS